LTDSRILADVAEYYRGKLRQFGATPAGVDWKDEASQNTRFDQLLQLVADPARSLVDFGCGVGALLGHMRGRGLTGPYRGIDIEAEMIAAAATRWAEEPAAVFEIGASPSRAADYAVASGIFNVRLRHDEAIWRAHVLGVLAEMDRSSRLGFAFNCLTSYADADRMRSDLYYADPCFYFDLCKRNYSRHVALLHDYGLYEFTIIVRKE
jgi:SAM-dependent methyltransferase